MVELTSSSKINHKINTRLAVVMTTPVKAIKEGSIPVQKSDLGYVVPDTPLFRTLPSSWIPYAELMRLDRPAGYYAFYWHYAIGLAFAACVVHPVIEPGKCLKLALNMALWVVVLRGAVCTVNDNFDQDFDRKVTRTRFRPIARGAVSTTQGHIFTLAQTAICAAILVPLPSTTWSYGVATMLALMIYPLGKRFTDFPQVILGFSFAIPIFMCPAAVGVDLLQQRMLKDGVGLQVTGSIVPQRAGAGSVESAMCLYIACALWTIIYDTVYAHQDAKDDKKAGVKSLAVRLGDQTKPWLGLLGTLQVAMLVGAGYLGQFSQGYFILTCVGAALALLAMLLLVDLESPSSCAWWFGPGSRLTGATMVAGLLSHYALRLSHTSDSV